MSDLLRIPALELARLIRERAITASEVVDAHLARIDDVNPTINAVVARNAQAHDQAAAADRALARGDAVGPLHGVPFTVKDIVETFDLPTVAGMPERRDTAPTTDAPVVAALRAAGGILLGKTNCPYGGGGIETVNDVFGRTNNPFDVTRTAGGSSGGEAAIVGAGGSPFGIGTDSGGSVRLPAHFCGVAAIKPSAGRLPLAGVLSDDGPLGPLSDPRTQVGILARSATDLAPLLAVLGNATADGWENSPVPLGSPDDVAVAGLRVGVVATNPIVELTAETAGAVQLAGQVLAAAGAHIRPTALPDWGVEVTNAVWRSYGPNMRSAEFYDVLRAWEAYRRRMAAFMEAFDLLVTPVFPVPAPEHGGTSAPDIEDGIHYTTPFSLTGWPCTVIRAGTSPDGLPIGVQLVARPWRDEVAIRTAIEIERATEFEAAVLR